MMSWTRVSIEFENKKKHIVYISMATKTTGLHERPTYNKLIREIQHGEKIKLPNRDALFLRNSPYLAFLDGQGTTEMDSNKKEFKSKWKRNMSSESNPAWGGL